MIEYIKGELTELTPTLATIEAGGIGYGLNISLNTFSAALWFREQERTGDVPIADYSEWSRSQYGADDVVGHECGRVV